MNEQEFLKRLIAMVEIGEHQEKVEILEILASTEIILDKTRIYAKKNQQYWEDIKLQVAIPLLKKVEQHKQYLIKLCESIYVETETLSDYERGYALRNVKITPGALEVSEASARLAEVHFEEIQAKILEQIRNAKYTIWIAVAWFTDRVIIQELINKSAQGINVQVIVDDDHINQPYFTEYESRFEVIKAKKHGAYGKNIMHNKFCVIDLKTVLHGSYNWSNRAQYNKETISIEVSNRDMAEKFANEFIELKKFYNKQQN